MRELGDRSGKKNCFQWVVRSGSNGKMMKMKRRMEENESVLFIPKRANVFTCLMSIGSFDKKKRTRKDVDNVEMMMTTTMTMKERNTRNG